MKRMRGTLRPTAILLALTAFGSPAMQADPPVDVTGFEPTPLEREIFNGRGITVTRGEDIYATVCAGCHMPEGQGAIGAGMYPALQGNEKLEYPDYPNYIVINGYKAMPAFGHILSNEQVANLVNYLQSGLNEYEPTSTPDQVAFSRPQ